MSGDVHSQRAQLLHQSPNLRATRPDLRSDLRPADHDRRVAAQQLHDAAQTRIRLRRRPERRLLEGSSFLDWTDFEIMRQTAADYNDGRLPTLNRIRAC